ncbi:hypothetical protein INT47_008544 [Mucor saturninus]|uniref:C2H2-type domain-containing protein n=1 Tax=Mucor saturninus TaxID=64648 RepID=A0A8H7V5T0_9FUNG|nr:hypothetical protein INT47_008544 [Mucor saturninus]
MKCHVLHVKIGEKIIDREENGFPCPACENYLSNGATFKTHLKKHQLSCDFIFDATVDLAVRDTPVSVTPELPFLQELLKSPAPFDNHFPPNASNSSAYALPLNSDVGSTDNTVFGLDFAVPAEHERLVFENIDVSCRFRNFQLQVKRRLNQNKHLTLEENVQHLLALSSILLLKPGRTHTDIHKHITFSQCENLRVHILNSNGITSQMLSSAKKEKLEVIIHNLIENVSNNIANDCGQSLRLVASCKIAALIGEDAIFNTTNRILLAVRNMVEALPRFVIEDGPKETELITRYLQAALTQLLISNLIPHNRTSISDNDKVVTLRPDASINVVYGAVLDQRLGCGEVKSQYHALNHRLTGMDLLRVAHLAKSASDEYKAIATFAFTVVGNHGTFYVLHRAKANTYTLCEVEHIQLALKLADIPIFIAQSTKIAKIISSFEHVLNCGTHHYDEHPATLTDHMLLQAINPKTSRKRKSISSHYNH